MIVVGLMSGTSADAIDVAVAELTHRADELRLRPLVTLTRPLPSDLRGLVHEVVTDGRADLADICRLDAGLGRAFAAAAAAGLAELDGVRGDLVVSHGQTVHHLVEDGEVTGSLQLGAPAWIAERTGLPVVADLRARDIAAGGQGAPLVSLIDTLLLGTAEEPAAALNLGGIANVTVVAPGREPIAFDVGPANALLDAAARRYLDADRDEGGAAAARGTVDQDLLAALLDDDYLRRPPPKTTGRERYDAAHLEAALAEAPVDAGDDVLTTLVATVARSVADALADTGVRRVVVSGGGVRNPTLLASLTDALAPTAVITSDELGVPADAKEALAFAVLGYLTWHGAPATVPSCTGAVGARLLGSITPGTGPLAPPPPMATTPTRLTVGGQR